MGVVNTFVNSEAVIVNAPGDVGAGQVTGGDASIGGTDWVRTSDLALMKRPL